MATLREIRRRIAGVKSTQKITKAMKMVAAARLRRAQDSVIAARPYARTMQKLIRHLASVVDTSAHPLFVSRPLRGVSIVVVTADRGLCGAFNANVIRATIQHLKEQHAELLSSGRVRLFCVGRKGADFFLKNRYTVAGKHIGVFSDLKFTTAQEIAQELLVGFERGETDRVEVVYNEFKSIIRQRVVIEQFLPLTGGESEVPGKDTAAPGAPPDYIYEPSGPAIISSILPKYLNFRLWHMLLESSASEQGARMTAMDNATTNASDLIRDLQLAYNKARQASITKELLEIVSGAEALRTAE